MSTILITGGAGFIGSNLALRLHREGHNILILDNLSEQIHGFNPEETSASFKLIQPLAKFIKADIRDRVALKQALINVDTVVHLAAETGTGQSQYLISKYCDVNIQGTTILLEEIANLNEQTNGQIKKIIVASSRAIYGEGQYNCPTHGNTYPSTRDEVLLKNKIFDPQCPSCNLTLKPVATLEEAPAHPRSVYGITKLTQEQLVLNFAQSMNISAFALRFQNVYGPGQSLSNPYTGILSIFSSRARANNSILIFEDGLEG